jgi:hypothetical protein
VNHDHSSPKKQVEVSPPKGRPISLAAAAKASPYTEAKLRRLVASGLLRSVIVEPDPGAKRPRGRQTRIWVYREDIEKLVFPDNRAAADPQVERTHKGHGNA